MEGRRDRGSVSASSMWNWKRLKTAQGNRVKLDRLKKLEPTPRLFCLLDEERLTTSWQTSTDSPQIAHSNRLYHLRKFRKLIVPDRLVIRKRLTGTRLSTRQFDANDRRYQPILSC